MTGRRQPQRIPPPIDHGSERIDAELVLREYPGELGVALWKTVRTVRLWTALRPEARGSAFRPGAYERRYIANQANTRLARTRIVVE